MATDARQERIRELEFKSRHYLGTHQKENIIAAREWHSQFPPDRIIPEPEYVVFQHGNIVKEKSSICLTALSGKK